MKNENQIRRELNTKPKVVVAGMNVRAYQHTPHARDRRRRKYRGRAVRVDKRYWLKRNNIRARGKELWIQTVVSTNRSAKDTIQRIQHSRTHVSVTFDRFTRFSVKGVSITLVRTYFMLCAAHHVVNGHCKGTYLPPYGAPFPSMQQLRVTERVVMTFQKTWLPSHILLCSQKSVRASSVITEWIT